jgi:hypothetical protein
MWLGNNADETCRLLLRIPVPARPEQSRALSGRVPGWGEDAATGPVYDGRQKKGADALGSAGRTGPVMETGPNLNR